MANKVLFYRGLFKNYDAESMTGAIYFATDLGEIWIDGKRYGNDNQQLVQDVTLTDDNLVVTYNTFTEGVQDSSVIAIADLMKGLSVATSEAAGLMSAEDKAALDELVNNPAEAVYVPNEALFTVSSAEHGALGSRTGQEFKDAKLSFSEMFDAILFPTINPVITNPSASISVSDSDKNVEVGAVLPTYSVTYNDGEVKLSGAVQHSSYGGEKTGETVTLTDGLVAGTDVMPAKNVTYNATVTYAAGTNQPMTNKNEAYGSVCAAGSTTASVTVYPYYVYYATTSSSSTEAVAQSVLRNAGVSSVTTPELTLNAHTAAVPQVLKLPVRTMTKLQMYNTVAGKYEDVSFTNWTLTTETLNDVTYNVYTYAGEARGSVKVKVTF